MTEKTYMATSVSAGVGMGHCIVLYKTRPQLPERTIKKSEVSQEIEKFEKALESTTAQLKEIGQQVKALMGTQNSDIFESHQLVLQDQVLLDEIVRLIEKELLPADLATQKVANKYIHSFEHISDEFFRQRVVDVRDVTNRLIDHLTGWVHQQDLSKLEEPVILVAKELTPSQTVQLEREKIAGIVTENDGVTSHVSILARSLGIPAVTGISNVLDLFSTGDFLLLDGYLGKVIANPSEKTKGIYKQKLLKEKKLAESLKKEAGTPVVTVDGRSVIVAANLAQPEDALFSENIMAQGIGLFRTEFFFLRGNELPTENEQYEVYRDVATSMKDMPVVIRTLDVGGDKSWQSLKIPKEENPFLGCRAIRFCLSHLDIFKVQLRALLRAAAEAKNIRIMYPMISGIQELDEAQKILHECMAELDHAGIPCNHDIEVGAMIEIPSAVICAKELAEKVDFFSIGTNDLIQYTLAVDRMNPIINYLYKPTHPAIIRLISQTVELAQKKGSLGGIPVAICGEMAGMPELTPLLIGLGVDELSVSFPQVIKIQHIIRRVQFKECQEIAIRALNLQSPEDIWNLSENFARKVVPELFS